MYNKTWGLVNTTVRPTGAQLMTLKSLILFTFTLIFYVSGSIASENQSGLITKLHTASENIEIFTNHESVDKSIYKQIRPRANVTNTKLSASQIDEKVRQYISEKYEPALISNYSFLYSKLKLAKKDFSSCEDLNPFNLNENVLMALCLKQENNSLRVQYMTNGYGRGWSISAIFVFEIEESSLKLSSIELQLKEGVKVYVDGI